MHPTDAAALQELDDADGEVAPEIKLSELESIDRLAAIAQTAGDISHLLTNDQLTRIGAECIADFDRDENDRTDWRETVENAFKLAAQEKLPKKDWPWPGAANISFPLLTTAALQFAARAYPAIVKGDEAVSCKVVGKDQGRPQMGPDGQPMALVGGQPVPASALPQIMAEAQATGQQVPEPQPMWQVPPGAKASRAGRVKDYMNTVIFYRMSGWEEDTDALLHQLPIAGCAFRKVWPEGGDQKSALVPALKLVAPMTAKDCYTAPRLTEIMEDQPLNDIIGLQRQGFYRDVTLVAEEDEHEPRKLLEQHCLIDLDDDGYDEPYIVTLDHASTQVLRIEPSFGPEDVAFNDNGEVVAIKRRHFYVKYDFFPSLEGKFYGTGLGHLLEQIGDVVNKAINQMIDAGAAQVAGGGFIGSGVNLQGAGKRSSVLYFQPGEYKTVQATGAQLRDGIYERTFPGPSPIMFQVLELMLGAARDISSVKDVLTGEAKNTGQVGTTLALIEQGLQVFTAIYKRIYRSLKAEFAMLFANIAMYGGEATARDYATVLDDPAANFADDFNATDMDIRPVSDPSSVTKMQAMAKAQWLGQFLGAPGVNPQAIMKRMFEAADVDDIDELMMPPQPPPAPDPKDVAQAENFQASAVLNMEKAQTEAAKRDQMAYEQIAAGFQQGAGVGEG